MYFLASSGISAPPPTGCFVSHETFSAKNEKCVIMLIVLMVCSFTVYADDTKSTLYITHARCEEVYNIISTSICF